LFVELHCKLQPKMLMEWESQQWIIFREHSVGWKVSKEKKPFVLSVYGKEGSIWGTAESRLQHFGSVDPPVENIFCIENCEGLASLSVEVQFKPCKFGSQAGIVYYLDDLTWMKLVYEGDKNGGTMIILATQIRGEPEIFYKGQVENSGHDFLPLKMKIIEANSDGMILEISGRGFDEKISINKLNVPEGKFGLMAHSIDSAVEETDRWAHFRNLQVE
jgi:hypothetical protein